MIYLLDTTAVSQWMNEHRALERRLAVLTSSDQTIICPIVTGELLYGIARLEPSKRRDRLEAKARAAFAAFRCEPIPERAGGFYALVRREQEAEGLSLGANDLWIAATVLALDATLVSSDKDFARIDGFRVENWMV